ncbi:dihydrofolate reductase family protein [Nocardioides daeguensis]|uniref:Dihydrofolate reductase family protein n=1 Tax=Nocardioides daeguensis TaxID=908359 RepID=A0ABP6VBL2_9ACTN|nr:dihydrofolate reductase family protein [Nocardioides daeguensis]MBV6726040.1 dihydrofolate reductase family protein [Nocardioides daeguensis]MCR1771883.1 dihydrofolate reductase family protein [Nocardioides daeguensis]
MSTVYYTATTLDGFLADPDDSLAWLLRQDLDESGPQNYGDFIATVGALVMGSTTYEWVLAHLAESGEPWFYSQPTWVMTTRELPVLEGADVRFARGDIAPVYDDLRAAAAERDVWVVGGGDLAGQLADAGLLDRVIVSIAPVVLGAGRPLLPRRLDLRLEETARNGAFVTARYAVDGPLREDRPDDRPSVDR